MPLFDDYYQQIITTAADSGRSFREISIAAVGHESALRNLKNGKDVRISTILGLCKELGIEVILGPANQPDDLNQIKRDSETVAGDATLKALDELLNVTAYLRDTALTLSHKVATPKPDYKPGIHPEVAELAAYAGDGATTLGNTVVAHVPFKGAWLESLGIDPDKCIVISVRGESMEPTLPDGCSILVSRAKRRRRQGRVYVLYSDEGVLVKRLVKQNGNWLLRSDNPALPDMPWTKSCEIVGEVCMMATAIKPLAPLEHATNG